MNTLNSVPEDYVFKCWVDGTEIAIDEIKYIDVWKDGTFSFGDGDGDSCVIGDDSSSPSKHVEGCSFSVNNEKFQELLLKAHITDVMR